MLKKTTVYLEESDLENLKALSFIQKKSVTELIRLGVRDICQNLSSEEQKALQALTKVKGEMKEKRRSREGAMEAAVKVQKDVRGERQKKKSRRH